jgi:hypothetical protein
MSTTTDWITAISTVIYTMATIFLVVIAWQAKNTWRNELKIKRRSDLAENLLLTINKINTILTIPVFLMQYDIKTRTNIAKEYMNEIELNSAKYDWYFEETKSFISYFRKICIDLYCLTLEDEEKLKYFLANYQNKESDEKKSYDKKFKEATNFCKKQINEIYK